LTDLQLMEHGAKVSHKGSHRSTSDAASLPSSMPRNGGVRRDHNEYAAAVLLDVAKMLARSFR
jgi:hypothetical protein